MQASRIVIASPHRYPDLARLWYRGVSRGLVPALQHAGMEVEVVIFRDAHADKFDPARFPGAVLEAPGPGVRDFLEFYDAALALDADYLFLLDADLFFVDPDWPVSWLPQFDDPDVAAVSFLRRSQEPGVYALLCRTAAYRALPRPVFAPAYEDLEDERNTVNRQPGDVAARRLRERGRKILYADPAEAETRIADFHGTTVIRASREVFGHLMDGAGFEGLISRKRYFAMGAYDNALLGCLYQSVFGEPFAPGPGGEPLGGSVPAEAVRRELAQIRDADLKKALEDYFLRSDRAILRLGALEGIDLPLPALRPDGWRRA
jgi:hypothetical protein